MLLQRNDFQTPSDRMSTELPFVLPFPSDSERAIQRASGSESAREGRQVLRSGHLGALGPSNPLVEGPWTYALGESRSVPVGDAESRALLGAVVIAHLSARIRSLDHPLHTS
jgi:hypothetical protein